MKKIHYIYTEGNHKWTAIARDPNRHNYLIDTNEYLIINRDELLLTNPEGMEIFPAVFSAISTNFDPHNITALFASHQDPDIISSLALWLDFKPELKCYLSWLWSTFVSHFVVMMKPLAPCPMKVRKFHLAMENWNSYRPIFYILRATFICMTRKQEYYFSVIWGCNAICRNE